MFDVKEKRKWQEVWRVSLFTFIVLWIIGLATLFCIKEDRETQRILGLDNCTCEKQCEDK